MVGDNLDQPMVMKNLSNDQHSPFHGDQKDEYEELDVALETEHKTTKKPAKKALKLSAKQGFPSSSVDTSSEYTEAHNKSTPVYEK